MAATSSVAAACFRMKAEAPARSDSAARSTSACIVRTITFATFGAFDPQGAERPSPSALSRRSASSPLMPGMARSVTTTSGSRRRAASRSWAPSVTVATTVNSLRRRLASPSATTAWSSASSTVARDIPSLRHRHSDPQLGAALRPTVDRQPPPDQPDTLVETDQPQPLLAASLGQIEPAPVIDDGQDHVVPVSTHGHPRVTSLRVARDVAEALLRHAVEAQRDVRRHDPELAV